MANCQCLPVTQPWCSEANWTSYLHVTLTTSKWSSNTLGLRSGTADDRKLCGFLLVNDNVTLPRADMCIWQAEKQWGVNLPAAQTPSDKKKKKKWIKRKAEVWLYMEHTWLIYKVLHEPEMVSIQIIPNGRLKKRPEGTMLNSRRKKTENTLRGTKNKWYQQQKAGISVEANAMRRQTWPSANSQYICQQDWYLDDSRLNRLR